MVTKEKASIKGREEKDQKPAWNLWGKGEEMEAKEYIDE